MTKKHFIALAAAIRDMRLQLEREHLDTVLIDAMTLRIAAVCQDSNPRFDRARFLSAAGYAEGQ